MKSLLVVLLAAGSLSLSAGIATTKHDLSSVGPGVKTSTTQVCVFCHTPHNTNATQLIPLWNKNTTLTSFTGATMYSSTTLQGTIGALGGASLACMTCHDGTTSVAAVINTATPITITGGTVATGNGVDATGKVIGINNIGTTLANDHPVSITYSTDPGLVLKATVLGLTNSVKLYGALGSEKVECSSCHNVHDNATASPFLRVTMTTSQLCTTCHLK